MHLFSRIAGHLQRNLAPYAVLVIGLLLAVGAAQYARRQLEADAHRRFDLQVTRHVSAIEQRIQAYVDVLRASKGFFVGSDEVNRAEFARYIESLEIRARYPGIQGVGWTVVLPPEEVPAYEEAVRAEGFPEFRVWPEGEREVYTSITYLEPFGWRNRRAFGYDMFSEPTRRAAMARARDTGEPAASGRVVLVQEAGKDVQAGFLIYLPVYDPVAPTTLEARRERVRGYVYSPFRAGDLFTGIFGGPGSGALDFEIYDGTKVGEDSLLYDDDPGELVALRADPGAYHEFVRIEVAGRPWVLFFKAGSRLALGASRPVPSLVLLGGLVLAGLLFAITRQMTRSRIEAEVASQRAGFLAEAGELLNQSLDPHVTLTNLARLAVPVLADWCSVQMGGPEGESAQLAVAAARADVEARTSLLAQRLLAGEDPRSGLLEALRTGRPVLHRQIEYQDLVERFGPRDARQVQDALGPVSAMLVPLLVRGQALGALVFLMADSGRHYDEEDLELAVELARRAAIAVENARLFEEVQQAVRVRDEFLSVASHELKTPLTSLQLQAQSLLRTHHGNQAPGLERKLGTISRQVERLTHLINELLDVSRITSGRLSFHLEEVDLLEVVTEVLDRLHDELERAGTQPILRAGGPVVGTWDRMRLEQVVMNLVSNASKYGAGQPVEIGVRASPDEAVLVVRDRGLGIEAADLNRIFERFERAVSERNYGGLGLGLWIVRQIVEGLGGRIEVDSALGQGATFTVRLPRQVEIEARAELGT